MKSQRTHFLSVLFDRVHRPSATVRVAPIYRMCRRVGNFVLFFCAILWASCLVLWKSLWILKGFFCTNPVITHDGHHSNSLSVPLSKNTWQLLCHGSLGRVHSLWYRCHWLLDAQCLHAGFLSDTVRWRCQNLGLDQTPLFDCSRIAVQHQEN